MPELYLRGSPPPEVGSTIRADPGVAVDQPTEQRERALVRLERERTRPGSVQKRQPVSGSREGAARRESRCATKRVRKSLEHVTKPPKPDPRRRSSVNGYGCSAASRSIVGSSRTVLAHYTTSAEGRTAAHFGSRVSDRHFVRPPQRHPLADAPAGTRVRFGDDVLAPPARLATSGRVRSHSLRAAGLARSKGSD